MLAYVYVAFLYVTRTFFFKTFTIRSITSILSTEYVEIKPSLRRLCSILRVQETCAWILKETGEKCRGLPVQGAIHTQLNWAILLCDVMTDGKTE